MTKEKFKVIYEVVYDGTEAGYDVSKKSDRLKMVDYDFGGTADGRITLTWKSLEKRLNVINNKGLKNCRKIRI